MSNRLTKKERDAVVDVLNEKLAGDAEDLRDALGLETVEAGEAMLALLDSAMLKLTGRTR
jgi:hypothetical protein